MRGEVQDFMEMMRKRFLNYEQYQALLEEEHKKYPPHHLTSKYADRIIADLERQIKELKEELDAVQLSNNR
jgi:hypothetical protein